ncbi:hypothetical protein M1555_02050 [Patescibacteria group bacterium]|nr:hypothetical protein [Patescibacteria group bacterium]
MPTPITKRYSAIQKRFLDALPYLIIAGIVTALFWTNYIPGTWLTGWDNLHPEFNFRINIIDRSIFSTWQEYQGLGVRAGNAHAADLLHQIGLWITSLFLNPSILRYFYHFLALAVGGIGAYELLKRKVVRTYSSKTYLIGASLCGALFYILNLGTMQYFYVPYEAFSHFFASLPWLLLALLAFLEKPGKRTGLFFTLVNLLAIPSFYIPTVFVVYLIMAGAAFLFHTAQTKSLRLPILATAIIVAVNAYWLFPFVSFVAKGTTFVSEVKINRIFTGEAFLRNQEFGTLPNVALLKGFLFDTTDLTGTSGTHEFIMKPWMNFLAHPEVRGILYAYFIIIILGYIWAIISKKKNGAFLFLLFVLSLVALINDNPPTGWLFSFLQLHLPFFNQIFRFPFTKFIPLASLTYAIGLTYGMGFLLSLPFAHMTKTKLSYALYTIIITLLISVSLPSFRGNFIYSAMKQKIPPEYFSVYQFFQTQPPEGKIANLPQPSFWGWEAYDWGYRGSGFPWYGIQQPILDRAFDVWNTVNQTYYQDLTDALFTKQSTNALEGVLDKYDVRYIWLDERVLFPGKQSLLFINKTKKLLASSKYISTVFSAGKQTIFEYSPPSYVHAIGITQHTSPKVYPFEDITRIPSHTTISEHNNNLSVSSAIPAGTLVIPPITTDSGDITFSAENTGKALEFTSLLPDISIQNQPITLPNYSFSETLLHPFSITSVNGSLIPLDSQQQIILRPMNNDLTYFSNTSIVQTDLSPLLDSPLHNCIDQNRTAQTEFDKITTGDGMLLQGRSSHPCLYDQMKNFFPAKIIGTLPDTYLLTVTFDYQSNPGTTTSLCITREGENSCLFHKILTSSNSSNKWVHANISIPIMHANLSSLWLKFELNADREDTLQSVTLKNIKLSVNPAIKTVLFNRPELQQTIQREIPTATNVRIQLPTERLNPTLIRPADTIKSAQNCYTLGRGTPKRQILTDPLVGPYVRYDATDSSSCDAFPFYKTSLMAGGIATILNRNVSGRPIKACLAIDPPGNCLFEDILYSKKTGWKSNYYAFSSIGSVPPFQYFLTLDDYAVGEETRINDVASIKFQSVPIDWLKTISIEPKQPQGGEITVRGNTPISSVVTRYSPTSYTATYTIQKNAFDDIIFFQSFDPGWKAYVLNNPILQYSCSPIIQFLVQNAPFLFGTEVKTHILVNGWANGWDMSHTSNTRYFAHSNKPIGIPSNHESRTNEVTIVIFFLPQLLEWIGLLLLPIPFLLLLTKRQ